ncbi:hypothetical protein ALC60_06203, partial [Trachymyrmex zeteki]
LGRCYVVSILATSCVKLPVPAWEIGSMHEKIDCRLREKERKKERERERERERQSWKSWRKKPKGIRRGVERDEQRERVRERDRSNERGEMPARDRRFSRSFEFSSIKLTAFRWLASHRSLCLVFKVEENWRGSGTSDFSVTAK